MCEELHNQNDESSYDRKMECERNKSTGKLQIIVEQMAKQGISILGMVETFCKGGASFEVKEAINEKDTQL